MRWLLLLSSIGLAAACDDGGGAPDSPLKGTLFINEAMPKNDAACADENGAFPDWIEIFNAGDSNANLEGFAISDKPATPDKVVLPAGLTVPAGGFLLLWADGVGGAPDRVSFKLAASTEGLRLSDRELRVIDEISWENTVGDVSLARHPDGGAISSCAASTCGTSNGASCP